MKIGQKLLVTERAIWRAWLYQNHDTANEIWLVRYKKHTGKAALPYDDAVEEALCFGWIDGIIKRIDDEKYVIRFSPRRKNSVWSDLNRQRVLSMIDQKKMTSAGMRCVAEAKKNGRWEQLPSPQEALEIPPDLAIALALNHQAKVNFDNLAPSYRKQFIIWIESARRQETRQKRIIRTVIMTSKNQKPGMI
jgi:uncharacterized protein YdeI (YjbR/CyaY-like superfamily)